MVFIKLKKFVIFSQSTRTSRKKRDLGDIENVKTFEISTNWEITTDRDESYIN